MARLAHQKLEEIMRRDSHQRKLVLNSCDLYICNKTTLLHERKRVDEVPRARAGNSRQVSRASDEGIKHMR